tara:strand:+ start:472 stop:1338 length:867 start_codon:yes stop_codon:yes gene_type:complete
MAVKPITNKQLVNNETVNRAEIVSSNTVANRSSNPKKTYNPGVNFSKSYAMTLKDVDTSIINHIKNVMRLKVRSSGEESDVPVMYANQERWVNARKNNFLKDKSGAIVLPLIMLRRTSVDQNEELDVGMEQDVKRKFARVVRNSSWSKDNRYDRFAVQTGTRPVQENIITGVPDFIISTYEFIIWTNFIDQMNVILEAFVEQDNNYWGDVENYKFLSKVESITDATEMTVDTERFIKSTFTVLTKAYILPEYANNLIVNKISQTQRELTAGKVVFGFEGDATDKQING